MITTDQPVEQRTISPDEIRLLDQFASMAMQALLTIGAARIREYEGLQGRTFEFPDQPCYFGEWESAHDSDNIVGVDSVAVDAYQVADAMLRRRRKLLAELAVNATT